MREPLEPMLSRELGRIAAPAELWNRVQNPRREERPNSSMAWALAAIVLLAVGVWGFHPGDSMSSDNPVRVREWIQARTGLDVPLPAQTARTIRVTGASVKGPEAEIAFTLDNHPGTLRVAKAPPELAGEGLHKFVSPSSWTMRGQLYTIACNDIADSRVACVLCHTGAERLTALN